MPLLEDRGPRIVGRYAMYEKIASGGMATVHLGRLLGPVGFSRTVAIKRLYPQYSEDPEFVSMFLDEARVAARIRHTNVVPTLDVVTTGGEIFLVMEYVHGETLGRILRTLAPRNERVPLPIVATIFSGVLAGLHAAHEAKNERGAPLGLVHRDVSPQNVMVSVDGVARVLDFGVAKATGRLQTTREGQLKGKIAYMAPEQLGGAEATRRTDVYAAAVCLWEAITGKRLYEAANEAALVPMVLAGDVRPPSELRDDLPLALDPIVMRGLDPDPAKRFNTAREMASALEAALPVAVPATVSEWLERVAAESIARQAAKLAEVEHASVDVTVAPQDFDKTAPGIPPKIEPEIPVDFASEPPPESAEAVPRSQMSSVALWRTPSPDEAGGRGTTRGRALLVVGAVAALAIVAGVVVSLRGSGTPAATPAGSGASNPLPVAAPEPVAPSAEALAPAAPSEAPATSVSGLASAPASASADVPAPVSSPAPSHARPHATPPKRAAPPPPSPTKGSVIFTNPG